MVLDEVAHFLQERQPAGYVAPRIARKLGRARSAVERALHQLEGEGRVGRRMGTGGAGRPATLFQWIGEKARYE